MTIIRTPRHRAAALAVALLIAPVSAGALLPSPAAAEAVHPAHRIPDGAYVVPGDRLPPTAVATDPRNGDVYVGAIGGLIYRSRAGRGPLELFAQSDGRQFVNGMKVTDGRRLVVADGQTGQVFVYDTRRGVLTGRFAAPTGSPTAVNDVAIAPSGDAYVTDSFRPVVYRIPAAALAGQSAAPRPLEVWLEAPGDIPIDTQRASASTSSGPPSPTTAATCSQRPSTPACSSASTWPPARSAGWTSGRAVQR
jgi:hypothetical protein